MQAARARFSLLETRFSFRSVFAELNGKIFDVIEKYVEIGGSGAVAGEHAIKTNFTVFRRETNDAIRHLEFGLV